MAPKSSREESAAQTQKHENGGCCREDWRVKLAGITAGGISTFSNVFIIITMTKREESTSELRVCGSSLIYFSHVLHSS